MLRHNNKNIYYYYHLLINAIYQLTGTKFMNIHIQGDKRVFIKCLENM